MNSEFLKKFSTEELEAEIRSRKEYPSLNSGWNFSPVGVWRVFSEGDISSKDLGYYRGHIVDIAFFIGEKGYNLSFYKDETDGIQITDINENSKFSEYKNVSFSIGVLSGTWRMTGDDRVKAMDKWLNTAPSLNKFTVEKSNFYACISVVKA